MTRFWTLMTAEWRKRILFARSYWVSLVADQVLFIIGFLLIAGLFDLVAGGNFDRWGRLSSLIGYLTWRVAGGCMVETVGSLADDARYGTLEQVLGSGSSLGAILLARGVVIIIYYTLRVLLMAVVIMPVLRIPLLWSPGGVWIYLLTLPGIFGLAFALGGLHLVVKNVSAIVMPLGTALLFLTGAMAPLQGISGLYEVSRFLPLSIGIDLMRGMMVNGQQWEQVWRSPAFIALLLNSGVYLGVGWWVLQWAQRQARRVGSLAHY